MEAYQKMSKRYADLSFHNPHITFISMPRKFQSISEPQSPHLQQESNNDTCLLRVGWLIRIS